MIHGRIREGPTRLLVAGVAIDLRARYNDRDVLTIRIVADVDHARGARGMATRRRTAGRDARVIEAARGTGKRGRVVAPAAVRIGDWVRRCLAKRTGDVAGVAGRA